MKRFGDSHLHTRDSDGIYSVEEIAEFGVKRGLEYIVITDHYPLPFALLEFDRRVRFTDAYIGEIMAVRERYAGKVDVCLGAEFDWLEPYREWTAGEIAKRRWDYVLGSIHWIIRPEAAGPVETKIEAGEQKAGSKRCPWELCAIDESEEAFVRGAVECGGVEGLVREYYRQVRLLIESGLFDGLGHFDLVKIFNKDDTLFPQDSAWYRQAVRETLDVLAKSAMCMEINTNGWYKRIGEQYPSEWILRETRARNIAITLSSDGHRGDSVGRDLERAWAAAKKAGYETWVRFVQRKRVVCRAI